MQVEAFLDMQFRARETHYRSEFPGADDDVVLADGVPVGRLYVERGEALIRIIDIAIRPGHRGGGIGMELLSRLIAEASPGARAVELHVEVNNPAQRLYRRLGFVPVAEVPPYLRMAWRPPADPADQPKTTS